MKNKILIMYILATQRLSCVFQIPLHSSKIESFKIYFIPSSCIYIYINVYLFVFYFCHSIILKLALKSCVPIGKEKGQ